MGKKRYGFFLSENEIAYLKKYKVVNKCSSQNEALIRILDDHNNFLKETRSKEVDELSDKLCKKVVEQLKGVKLGINNADRNTQILIEMINGRYIKDKVGNIVTTTGLTTETAKKSEALEIAECEIKKKFIKQR